VGIPYHFGGVSKSMLALNKSVIKVKESQIKGFKMIFELFRKVATSPKSTPDSMTNSTIVTFNTDGKKLTDHLLATLKCCDKTIPILLLRQVGHLICSVIFIPLFYQKPYCFFQHTF
jgi:hypothetical protein